MQKGYQKMSISNVSICSIVRDCQKNLKRNIPKIEKLRKLFFDSEVIIFENDSKDSTPEIIKNWANESRDIIYKSEKLQSQTIPQITHGENPYYSKYRIEKMSRYRNSYMEILNSNGFKRDYVIIIDLDIANFSIKGIVNSFGVEHEWSCIASNGISLSKNLTWQYHDTYSLVEKGCQSMILSEQTIYKNRKAFSFLKHGMPLFPVESAFGGLAIYDWNNIKNKYYSCMPNNDNRVEALCEHISLNYQLKGNVFINPNMKLKYRSITFPFIIYQIKKRLGNIQQSGYK